MRADAYAHASDGVHAILRQAPLASSDTSCNFSWPALFAFPWLPGIAEANTHDINIVLKLAQMGGRGGGGGGELLVKL